MNLYFTDVFGVTEEQLNEYGAFNVSLVVDLPLFIDPFLLFDSDEKKYQVLHEQIIGYLSYLKDLSTNAGISKPMLKGLYCFSEVEQNWLGFCKTGNRGRGLGMKFANALNSNLARIFGTFGEEKISDGSHLEKLCLITSGVGKDMISDFTTNLIKSYLCEYTQVFAKEYLSSEQCRECSVPHVVFKEDFQKWMSRTYYLPYYNGDYVLLTPKDILTKDDTWINKTDFIREYSEIPQAIGNSQLRAQIDAYFQSRLPKDHTKEDETKAAWATAAQFPELFDYFIKRKEDKADLAHKDSAKKVGDSSSLYVRQFGSFVDLLKSESRFYNEPPTSSEAAFEKIQFLKDVIENKGGWRLFYLNGEPIRKEEDLQILYRLVWHKTNYDVSREVNDGRGPADFKVSLGGDKTIIEMKLASNPALRRQLENQAEIYQKASDAETAFKVVLCFTPEDQTRVSGILKEFEIEKSEKIILIDARNDNKPSASKAKKH